MKILVVGDGHSAIHEVAATKALENIGHQVEALYWHKYFDSKNKLIHQWRRAQNKFIMGPVVRKINSDLIALAAQFNPKLIFIYRGTHINKNTILKIKKKLPNCLIYGYNNDDPFAEGHSTWLWRHFLKCVSSYDLVFAYRHHNITEFKKIGAKHVELLRSWYLPDQNFPISLVVSEQEKYGCDVVFIGHYENDGRLEYLEEVVKSGYKLRLFGPGYEWDSPLSKSAVLKHLVPVHLIWNENYNMALCAAKIALCFFSKLNRDTYTRRCFEIPASGTLLLSEYSDDLASLYRQGEEADMFKTKQEMIEKIRFYLNNPGIRKHVADNGNRRVIIDGHDIQSRMRWMVSFV